MSPGFRIGVDVGGTFTDVVCVTPSGEIILVGRGAKSYLRTFQIGSRLYTLAVDVYGDSGEADEMPSEVQQFFDSFTFWG